MNRNFAALGIITVALGLWIGDADSVLAQKGGGGGRGGGGGAGRGGGGGGGGRSFGGGAPRSAPSIRSSPSIRTAPSSSFRSAPTFKSSPAAKSFSAPNASMQLNASKQLKSFSPKNYPMQLKSFSPSNQPLVAGAGGKKGFPAMGGAGKPPPKGGAGKPPPKGGGPGWHNQGHNHYAYNNYWRGGYYGYPFYPYYRYHNNDFWRFALYASIGDWIGYRAFGFPYYGTWGYAPYYYYDSPSVVYDPGIVQAQAVARTGSAVIDVILPDPNAEVWIDGAETTSRGTSRRYESPMLEAGWNYSYSIRAAWFTDDGETRVIERQVPLVPGGRVTIDFTTTPSRVSVN